MSVLERAARRPVLAIAGVLLATLVAGAAVAVVLCAAAERCNFADRIREVVIPQAVVNVVVVSMLVTIVRYRKSRRK